jgi:hypothetical protein
VLFLGLEGGERGVGKHGVVTPGAEQLVLALGGFAVEVPDPEDGQPGPRPHDPLHPAARAVDTCGVMARYGKLFPWADLISKEYSLADAQSPLEDVTRGGREGPDRALTAPQVSLWLVQAMAGTSVLLVASVAAAVHVAGPIQQPPSRSGDPGCSLAVPPGGKHAGANRMRI